MVTTTPRNPFKKRDRPHVSESEGRLMDLPRDSLYMIEVARQSLMSILEDVSEYLIDNLDNSKQVLTGVLGLRMELVNSLVRASASAGQYLHLVYTGEGYDAILSNIEPKALTTDEAIAQVRDLVQ